MIYLTYNDQPSGVFSSQVNDVCNYLNEKHQGDIRLVAFISVRDFSKNRKLLRKEVRNAWVIPALPTARHWKFSSLVFTLLCFLTGQKTVIARNIIAALMALDAKKRGAIKSVCLDGRGAIAAEWKEYDVVAYDELKKSISEWEKRAVIESNYRISVSEKLVEWWGSEYGYSGTGHVVIPCTLHTSFKLTVPSPAMIHETRISEGFADDDIIMVYSGSTSGWQSFNRLGKILGHFLSSGKHYKLLFLSKTDEHIEAMKKQFPGQVFNRWLTFDKVQPILSMCDYGILYREESITNKVAAPTKFAEYLSAGLPVMISPGIGDYSAFVASHNCGMVLTEENNMLPQKTTNETRANMIELVSKYYTKPANDAAYSKLIKALK